MHWGENEDEHARSRTVVACVVAVATASHGTHAERINMSKLTCIGYLQASDPGGANLMWMADTS
jgi:hypothetical protein